MYFVYLCVVQVFPFGREVCSRGGGARSSRTWPWHLSKGSPPGFYYKQLPKRGSYLLDRLKLSQTVQNYSQESV